MPGGARRSVGRWARRMVVAVVPLALATGCTAAVPIAEAHVSLDGRRLELLLDACNADTQLHVDGSADAVAVQARRDDVVASRIASDDCQDLAYVDLERTLGDRPVVDRSDDRRVPVSRPQPGTGTQPAWPYDRERVTPAEYRAALGDLVRCLERRDPQITARIVRGLNFLTYDWTTADDEGSVEADAIAVCERQHLDPLA